LIFLRRLLLAVVQGGADGHGGPLDGGSTDRNRREMAQLGGQLNFAATAVFRERRVDQRPAGGVSAMGSSESKLGVGRGPAPLESPWRSKTLAPRSLILQFPRACTTNIGRREVLNEG